MTTRMVGGEWTVRVPLTIRERDWRAALDAYRAAFPWRVGMDPGDYIDGARRYADRAGEVS